jgi:hypothetical protein
VAPWLLLPDRDAWVNDGVSILYQHRSLSTIGGMCFACAKMGPVGYMSTKAWSYLFFFLKSRTVRPLEKMNKLEKVVLGVTISLFGAAGGGIWLMTLRRSLLDGGCVFLCPIWIVCLVLGADVGLSTLYLIMFVAPLRATIKANRALRSNSITGAASNAASRQQQQQHRPLVVTVQAVQVAPVGAEAQAAASPAEGGNASAGATSAPAASLQPREQHDRGQALESVMRKNFSSYIIAVGSSTVSLSLIAAAHVSLEEHLLRSMWLIGLVDLTITFASILHLMNQEPASSSSASTAAVGTAAVAAGTEAAGVANATANKASQSSAEKVLVARSSAAAASVKAGAGVPAQQDTVTGQSDVRAGTMSQSAFTTGVLRSPPQTDLNVVSPPSGSFFTQLQPQPPAEPLELPAPVALVPPTAFLKPAASGTEADAAAALFSADLSSPSGSDHSAAHTVPSHTAAVPAPLSPASARYHVTPVQPVEQDEGQHPLAVPACE